jgi:hypothetical protein
VSGAKRLIARYERTFWLRAAFLAHYDRDAEFSAALDELYERHAHALRDGIDRREWRETAFGADGVALAARFGLDRVQGDERGRHDGTDLVAEWAWQRMAFDQHGWTKRPSFPVLSAGAQIGDPTARVDLTLEWNPELETWPDARARLEREAMTAVVSLRSAAKATIADAGYTFDYDRPELTRDLCCLFWRMRFRWTWTKIAAEWDEREGTELAAEGAELSVERQVRRTAQLVGVDTAGWPTATYEYDYPSSRTSY